MTTRLFQIDGADVTLETRAFRQIVYWNHQQVSEKSTLRPRLVTTHAFTTAEPVRQIEVRVYAPGPGWIVLRDGVLVAKEPPAKWVGILWSVIALVELLDFATEPSIREGLLPLLASLAAIGFLVPRWSWNRSVHRLTPTAPSLAT